MSRLSDDILCHFVPTFLDHSDIQLLRRTCLWWSRTLRGWYLSFHTAVSWTTSTIHNRIIRWMNQHSDVEPRVLRLRLGDWVSLIEDAPGDLRQRLLRGRLTSLHLDGRFTPHDGAHASSPSAVLVLPDTLEHLTVDGLGREWTLATPLPTRLRSLVVRRNHRVHMAPEILRGLCEASAGSLEALFVEDGLPVVGTRMCTRMPIRPHHRVRRRYSSPRNSPVCGTFGWAP